ncbi:hypothetical protein ACFVWF_28240 [Rhodococcus qingshengii]|uniref:hypothetical protein n=1 Tax=Rhodococcus qingshengii TaxID=334542 RepID=UPI0036D7D246
MIVIGKVGSCQVAHRKLLGMVEHRQSMYVTCRAETSHRPTRLRERAMKCFTSPGHGQPFLSTLSSISPHFRPRRQMLIAAEWRTEMADRFAVGREITATDAAT